jgi:phage tail P2-like protein
MTTYTHTPEFGAFTVTGSDLVAQLTRVLNGATGSFALTGNSASFIGIPFPVSLLPPNNPTKLDLAQELTDAGRYPLDWDAVLRTKDPMRVDLPLLPLLAWERSTDLWNTNWPVSKKRYVTDIAFEMQRKKGTRAGIEQYVSVAGGQCLSIDAPPLMCFPGADPTPEETAAWLAGFDQLRTYRYSRDGFAPMVVFLPDDEWFSTCFPSDDSYFVPLVDIDVSQYLGNQTYLWQNGIQTPLSDLAATVAQPDGTVADYRIIVLPTDLSDVWFMEATPPDIVDGAVSYTPSSFDPIAARTISIQTDGTDYGANNGIFTSVTVAPGLDLVTVKPAQVMQDAPTKPWDWYLDAPPDVLSTGDFALFPTSDDRSEYNIYQGLYLYDPNSPGPVSMAPGSYSFLDNCWFQFPAYTAIVKVAVVGQLPACALTDFIDGFYLIDPDMSPLWDVVDAVRAAKSARDLVLIDTNAYSIVTAGVASIAGAITAGQVVQT